jgi:hypothetical protein
MNHSGDAAEQIVRMSLESVEVIAKITGTAAKEIALFLLAAMKSDKTAANGGTPEKLKLKGKTRLESMLKSRKALEIFSVKQSDLKQFAEGAKQYGIVYCVLRGKSNPDGLCDIMVKAEDAPKINSLVERFKFATVEKASVESEVQQPEADIPPEFTNLNIDVPDAPEENDIESLLNDLLGIDQQIIRDLG